MNDGGGMLQLHELTFCMRYEACIPAVGLSVGL